MKLGYNKNAADPIYKVQETVRYGEKVVTETRRVIGRHSELLAKGISDPLQYARNEVEKDTAKATELKEKRKRGEVDEDEIIDGDLNEKISSSEMKESKSTALNIGYFYLQYYYQRLGLRAFFEQLSAGRKFTYDCNDINRFLTYSRILDPRSKLGTYDHLDNFFEQPQIEYQHILRFLDVLDENYDSYISHLFHQSNKIHKRNTSVCYYDCTNFYFEKETEDDDYTDPVTGEILTGLAQYGPSKEHRPNPIVEMGLFMDGNGVPINMCIHSGSTNEQITAVPVERQLVRMFGDKPFIYCADAGLGSEGIRLYNSMQNRNFVVTQSIKELKKVMQEAVFDKTDYRMLSNNSKADPEYLKTFDKTDPKLIDLYNDKAYKVIPADKLVVLDGVYDQKQYKNGNTRDVKAKVTLKQYLLVTFSRKQFEYQRAVRKRQVDRAKNLLATAQDPEDVKRGCNDIRRFIQLKPGIKNKIKTEGLSVQDVYEINTARIAEEEKYDGYYCIATNLQIADEKDNPVTKEVNRVLEIMAQRYKIEEDFRIMKTEFDARPVYHRLENRIKAHFLICYTGLLVHRLLEQLLEKQAHEHYTIDDVIETLQVLNVVPCENRIYISEYTKGSILANLQRLTNLQLDRQYYSFNQINRQIKRLF